MGSRKRQTETVPYIPWADGFTRPSQRKGENLFILLFWHEIYNCDQSPPLCGKIVPLEEWLHYKPASSSLRNYGNFLVLNTVPLHTKHVKLFCVLDRFWEKFLSATFMGWKRNKTVRSQKLLGSFIRRSTVLKILRSSRLFTTQPSHYSLYSPAPAPCLTFASS